MPGSTAKIITDVNRQLVQDIEDSGQFMTIFFLAFTTESRQLEWVRAGPDPAIFYDPELDKFDELHGTGMALGVDAGYRHRVYRARPLAAGHLIAVGTDGVRGRANSELTASFALGLGRAAARVLGADIAPLANEGSNGR